MTDLATSTIGFVGAGNMAEALVRGILREGQVEPQRMVAADPSAERRSLFSALGIRTEAESADAVACDIVVLAIKPQIMTQVLQGIGKSVSPDALVISIAAGIRTETIAEYLPDSTRIVRVMPNTPMLVGKGIAGIAPGQNAMERDLKLVCRLFASAGDAVSVDESDLDAVTAVSGSGPAYVFRFVEALTEGGVEAGLSREVSTRLARATVIGAARLLEQSEETARVLRERVTSPGGTTEAALGVFEREGFEPAVVAGVMRACARSRELSGD